MERIRGLYFSNHHLTRDLLGNIAPLTFFAGVAVALFEPAQQVVVALYLKYLANSSFWTFVVILIIYFIAGWFVGGVVAFMANALHRFMRDCFESKKFGKKLSYNYWYNKDAEDIDTLYKNLFPNYQYLASGAAVAPTDKINVLKEYFRRYNPVGYSETYRQFMKVDVARAVLFYSLISFILSFALFALNPSTTYFVAIIISIFIAWMAVVELSRRVRKVVRTEYFFIIATARIRDDIQSESHERTQSMTSLASNVTP